MTAHRDRRSAWLFAIVFAGFALSAGIAWSTAAAAQQTPETETPPDSQQQEVDPRFLRSYVLVHSSLDRSAIWIGDRVTFTVVVECSHGTDILTDDLARDRLQTEELEILGVDQTREDRGSGLLVHRFV